jgi:hypothetical protein
VLCWYDAPGEVLVNDLDLCLVDAAGRRTWGNHPPGEEGRPDRVNTVEVIAVGDLPAGSYVLEVAGANVPEAPQPYALAVVRTAAASPCNVPVLWIKGVGHRYGERLAAAGIVTVGGMMAARDDLHRLLAAPAGTVRRLRALLSVLAGALEQPWPASLPETTTLAALLRAPPPSDTPMADWQRARARAEPLLLVFDRSRLGRITLQQLSA